MAGHHADENKASNGAKKRKKGTTKSTNSPTKKKSKQPGALSEEKGDFSIPPPPPSCHCNQPACQRTVRKEGPNQGRKFWGCAQWPKKSGCQFFEWDTTTTTTTTTTSTSTSNPSVSKQPAEQPAVAPPREGLPIKIVTFNVAGFQAHSQAPRGFDPQQALEEELERLQPDVLALQELRDPYTFIPGYQSVGSAPSHCGFVGLFVRQQFLQDQVHQLGRIRLSPRGNSANRMAEQQQSLPVVLGSIQLDSGEKFVVGSCHLEPYKEGLEVRLQQLQAISKASKKIAETMILAGDMNMRQSEDALVEQQLANWKDAWKEAGSVRREAYTWNSKINHYHGKDSFQFHCRFDRVYLRNAKSIQGFRLMANEPQKDNKDGPYYLSDHFGIVTTVLI